MSTDLATTTAGSAPASRAGFASRLPSPAQFAVIGAVLGTAGAVVVATHGNLVRPGSYALFVANVVVGTFLVAWYWLKKRPHQRTGLLLLALGFANLGLMLEAAPSGTVHSVGVLFETFVVILGFYVVLAFPEGRLTRRVDRFAMWVITLGVVARTIPQLLFSPTVTSRIHLGACGAACPKNPFMIADRPGLASPSGPGSYAGAAIALLVAAVLIARLVAATPPRRGMLAPVYAPAVLLTLAIAATQAAGVDPAAPAAGRDRFLAWALVIARSTWAYGFLLALVLTSVFAGIALKQMVAQLGPDARASRLRDVVASAVHDPSLEVGFRISGDSFVGSGGEWLDLRHLGAGQAWTTVESEGRVVAVIVHDKALNRDPELMRAAGRVVLLARQNNRLERDLRVAVEDLRASRGRIATARDAERRRIERDLHDGAQQRLVSLRIKLARADELMQNDPERGVALICELGAETEEALEEIRALAQGVYPTVLIDQGIAEALRSLARRMPIATTVEAAGLARYSPDIESAVYFCCVEALQNVVKHAPGAQSAAVSVSADRSALRFEVSDDGPGFPAGQARSGAGFTNLRDRLAVVGGELDVQSRVGVGTRVRGTVPLRA